MPEPDEDLDSDSEEEHSDLLEQSSESSSDDSLSELSDSSFESYIVDEDEGSEELSSEEETETASTTGRPPSTPNKVLPNQKNCIKQIKQNASKISIWQNQIKTKSNKTHQKFQFGISSCF